MADDAFSFFDLSTGDLRATVHAVDGQLIVRDAASKRYVHSFALRNKTSGVMLAVREHSEIEPGESIDVIEAMRLRPGTTLEGSAYRSFPLRFGPLLLAMQRGEEFLDIE